MTRLSCRRSRSEEVRLWLSVIRQPGESREAGRRLVLPTRISHGVLTYWLWDFPAHRWKGSVLKNPGLSIACWRARVYIVG